MNLSMTFMFWDGSLCAFCSQTTPLWVGRGYMVMNCRTTSIKKMTSTIVLSISLGQTTGSEIIKGRLHIFTQTIPFTATRNQDRHLSSNILSQKLHGENGGNEIGL